MTRITASLALACLAGSTLSQQTIVVPDDIPTLSLALNPAVSGLASGDTIELRDTVSYAGTFTITTPDITIREAAGDTVVVDAFSTGSVFTVDTPGGTTTFEGLTIQNGVNPGSNGGGINVVGTGGVTARDCDFDNNTANAGGALYSVSPDLVLEDCTFTGNSSTLFGGAVRFAGASGVSFTVSGCTFTANQATGGNGGAIDHAGSGAVLTITDSTFSMNTCTITGGAVFATNPDAVRMERVDFIDNIALGTASQDTGGAFISNCSDVLIRDTSFTRNLCAGSGGGLRFSNSMGDVIDCRFIENESSSGGAFQVVGASAGASIYNSVFDGNSARRDGSDSNFGGAIQVNSGFPEVYVYNSLFTNNTAGTGGAIAATTEGEVFVYNSTFVGNDADTFGGAVSRNSSTADTVLNSCIVWGNLPSESQVAIGGSGLDEVNYSLVEGGYDTEPGVGNIDGDPMFADASNGDYSLSAGSPAIDAGSSTRYGFGPLSDLAGNDRGQDDADTTDTGEAIIGAVIDMGAFEFTTGSGVAECPADQNFDGVLTPADFNAWILNYNNGCD